MGQTNSSISHCCGLLRDESTSKTSTSSETKTVTKDGDGNARNERCAREGKGRSERGRRSITSVHDVDTKHARRRSSQNRKRTSMTRQKGMHDDGVENEERKYHHRRRLSSSFERSTLVEKRRLSERPSTIHWPYDSPSGGPMRIEGNVDEEERTAIKRWFIWTTSPYDKRARLRGYTSRAWKSGFAFVAIVDSALPNIVRYEKDAKRINAMSPKERTQFAFMTAETHLHVTFPTKLMDNVISRDPNERDDVIDRGLLCAYLLKLQPAVDSAYFRRATMILDEERD